MQHHLVRLFFTAAILSVCTTLNAAEKPRVIVTTDGEIDDECSLVRFLLYANERNIEGIITSSSQYHWQGQKKGGMSFIGKANHSPGSDLIIKATDEKEERPVWVLAWGGGNTLAQAIWRVQEELTPEQLKAFLKKIRFYTITDQDRGRRVVRPGERPSERVPPEETVT